MHTTDDETAHAVVTNIRRGTLHANVQNRQTTTTTVVVDDVHVVVAVMCELLVWIVSS